ncbi:hypothetical protein Xmau_02978 [Xenorhabdus mauleonii]|uniref:Uncharacterized protein n=1 Tax=Xenorhabdus mauleonii TaxID=351675 RepID=A0A1I3T9L1_9GAMM|nr:hypothetical protein [Xenorhabdus mauleonii]PHM39371.1 hypothetical protein Xmau_02978 [Xenorhabdus mauleonii]SFJ66177.1 hypothetical protein SAMN05421680_1135 [Xenorhabdus mauleonii]
MYTFVLWDTDKYQPIRLIEKHAGNEFFLVQTDREKYPLLSELSDCDEEFYNGNEILQILLTEISEIQKGVNDTETHIYFQRIIELILEAINTNKSVVITPFAD